LEESRAGVEGALAVEGFRMLLEHVGGSGGEEALVRSFGGVTAVVRFTIFEKLQCRGKLARRCEARNNHSLLCLILHSKRRLRHYRTAHTVLLHHR